MYRARETKKKLVQFSFLLVEVDDNKKLSEKYVNNEEKIFINEHKTVVVRFV